MLKSERLQIMESYILEQNVVSMEKLCDEFQISINTVRSDVNELVAKGSVKKVYGGVCKNENAQYTSFDERERTNEQVKKLIAKKAATFIENGDVVYIDSGTTNHYLIDYISPDMRITVITASLPVMNKVSKQDNLELICLEGKYQPKTSSFISFDAVNAVSKFNIKKAFIGATGISDSGNLTNSSLQEYELKKAAILSSDDTYLLADTTKIGKTALMTFATIDQIDTFITDRDVSIDIKDICMNKNVELVTV